MLFTRATITRLTTWTFLLASGFALLLQSTAWGQDPFPQKDQKYTRAVGVMTEHHDSPRYGIPKAKLAEAQDAFKVFAKHYADVIAHPLVWKAQDVKLAPGVRIPTLDGPEGILKEIDRFLLEPLPGGTKPNFEPADYIREMGAAFDTPLKELIENHQERIVRINAARVLAHIARSGAPAHFKTVTTLLADPKTPTEIKYYLFQAAAALLNAIDVTDMKMRKHDADPKVIAALVKAVDDCITQPAMIVPGFKADMPGAADQLPVIGLVRRQAVRALAQVKYARIPGPDAKTPYLYPSYTLVRVAMSDPALNPPPSPGESAEAVIGLCRMAPMEWDATGNNLMPIKNYNPDIAVEAIIQGLITFAAPKVANPSDNTLPWRQYSLRIAEAIMGWKPLFDPNFDFLKPPVTDKTGLVPASVKEMSDFVLPKILAPMEQGGKIDVPGLRKLLTTVQQSPKRKSLLLFEGVKETTIDFPQPKK